MRSVVKLMNIEDTSIIDDMKRVQEEVKIILKKQTPVPCEFIDENGKIVKPSPIQKVSMKWKIKVKLK